MLIAIAPHNTRKPRAEAAKTAIPGMETIPLVTPPTVSNETLDKPGSRQNIVTFRTAKALRTERVANANDMLQCQMLKTE
ncbi:hypothetical protein CVT25_010123 [Psilocybe cyanescens]|uniref:Uncharacterized protein n=1 Tax=Psilocybe cyanescens TaxID=93625 RepID=A0A409XD08_PSICY|nr:hypothetical protein CVT25_010123 [Psilocybe cyanescens]